MSLVLDIPVLLGALVRLEPLSETHTTDLADAVEEDRSTFGHTWVPEPRGHGSLHRPSAATGTSRAS